MARRRRRKKKNALDYIALPKIDLDPDTQRSIFILVIFAFGVISLLSLFNLAGSLGVYVAQLLTLAFGYGKWFFPIIILAWAFIMYNEEKYYIRGTNYLGAFLFIVSIQSLFHFFIDQSNWEFAVKSGYGGGYLGMYLAKIFFNVLGFWAGLLILVCLFVGSLLLIFDTSLVRLIGSESLFARIYSPFASVFNRLFSRGEYEEEDEELESFDDTQDGEEIEEDDDEEEEESEEEIEIDEKTGFSRKNVEAEPEFMQEPVAKKIKNDNELGWKPSNIQIDLPMHLLSNAAGKPTSGDIKNNSLIIHRTLENFGIPVEMGDVAVGPTVTQYTFKPAEGIKLSRITTLNNDLALALAAHPIRIEAPIPGKALVGIEVPNQSKAVVGLRETLSGKEFKERKSPLMLALGKDVAGKSWLYDLCKMPHLLVAGATNSGKSVCLNTIIISLLYQNNPDDLKFIMVDPKRVELPVYNGIPHLLCPVITDVTKTINALKWCLNEMDRRFEVLSKAGKRNIQTYNAKAKPGEKMPYLVFIIDELADLMVTAARDIETSVIRIAQMARAVGIHLILATQRPSVDVITGLIKANMPARIAFSVASGTDSKTILDSLGAEKLLGQGDMLFLTAEISKPKRIQGAYVSDNEIKKIVNYIKQKGGEVEYVDGITDKQKVKGIGGVGLDGGGDDDVDDLFEEAKEIVINMGKASASLLQRRLSVGYARAARIMDELEEAGIIGGANGSKPREILISKEQYESMQSTGVSGASLHDRDEAEAPEEFFPDDEDDSMGEDSPDTPTVFKSSDISDDEDEDWEEDAEDVDEDEEETDDESFDDAQDEEEIEDDEDEELDEEESENDDEEDDSEESTDDEDLDEDEGMFFAK